VERSQRAGEIRADIDPMLIAGLLIAMALGVSVVTELRVPFDTPAHAGAVLTAFAAR
jgi:hypothetical protein